MKLEEETLKANYIYQGKVINVRVDDVKLPNNELSKREIVEHRGGVGIIPFDGENVYLVNQYRYALKMKSFAVAPISSNNSLFAVSIGFSSNSLFPAGISSNFIFKAYLY